MRLLFLLFLPTLLAAALPQPVVPDKVSDVFVPAAFATQQIDGFLGERMRINREDRLLRLDETGVMEGFEHRPGKQDWIGEHAGKFLDAAINAWQYSHDERVKALMDRVDRRLVAAQLPDGYLGTYTDDKRWTSWDVWTHKYDLIGLLHYYRATGGQPSLAACRKIGDLLVRTFGDHPGQRDIILAGEHVGMAATSVLEPMVMLYRYTGDRRYLEFCYYITRAWEQPNGPKIISSLLATGSVFQTANAKAYEMLSNLVGLADLYRVTGDTRFLAPLNLAWEDIVARRLYISGTASAHEHFTANDKMPADEKAEVGEGCVTVTWIQLNLQLLRLTGESKYGDQIERSVFNQLLAAQNPANGDICYFTPLNGRKRPTPGINCCVSSEPRGISLIPETVWGTRNQGPAILQYAPGRFTTAAAAITSQTDFPASGHVTLTVTPVTKPRFTLYLRVPEWTRHFTASVGGRAYTGHAGEFLSIDRAWKPGDQVDIAMEMSVDLISGGRTYPQSIAVQRGPQVLALEAQLNPQLASLDAAAPKSPLLAGLHFADASAGLPKSGPFHEAFAMDGSRGERLVLVPFADAQDYRVWLSKP